MWWRGVLRGVDAHFPLQVCHGHWYFSVDEDAMSVHRLVQSERLIHPPLIIQRGPDAGSWLQAMRTDLQHVVEDWIFALMDDSALADPLTASSVFSVLQAAQLLNASSPDGGIDIISLYRFSYNIFWNATTNTVRQAELPSAIQQRLPGRLFFASPWSKFVYNQNFALWKADALRHSLDAFAEWESLNASHSQGLLPSPQGWEEFWNRQFRSGAASLSNALALQYTRPDAMASVLDAGHQGHLNAGYCGCSWLRMAARVQLLAKDGDWAAPDGMSRLLNSSSSGEYRWCTTDLRDSRLPPPGGVHVGLHHPKCLCNFCNTCHCSRRT